MPINADQVRHVARLSRIALTPQETERFTEQLDHVLEYVRQLQRLDTTRVEPAFHVLPMMNVMREDRRSASLPAESAAQLAPDHQGSFVRVPLVVDDGV